MIEAGFRRDDKPEGHALGSATAIEARKKFGSDFYPGACRPGIALVLRRAPADFVTVPLGSRNFLLTLADALPKRTDVLNLLAHRKGLETRRNGTRRRDDVAWRT